MVAIARYFNVTLIVPELDKTSFWNDPSQFEDIFDVDHFITSLRDEVRILKQLPIRLKKRVQLGLIHTMPPVSWSDISYYHNQLNSGKVIGVGLGTRDKSGNTIPVGLKEGDTVLLPEYGGTEVKLGEKQYHLFRDEDILGTLHDYLLMNKLFL